jgi:sortase (surface protein transpeptidase)
VNTRTRLVVLIAVALSSALLGCGDEGDRELGAPVPGPTVVASLPTTPLPVATAERSTWSGALPNGASTVMATRPAPVRIRIESVGIDAPVVAAGIDAAGALELARDADAAAWFAAGPAPGESGSAVIAAHVDYDGERGVFFALGDLPAGTTIEVELSDAGARKFVTVGSASSHPKLALPVEDIFRRGGDAALTLVTCGGAFDPGSRSYSDNVIVRAVPL